MTFDEFVQVYARQRDLTDERARYTGATACPSHVIAQRLPESFEERKECARYPDQVVWTFDDALTVVVWESIGERSIGGELVIEEWSSHEGYHERLDDLAGVRT